MIVRILIYILLTVFTSFYFFPFEFTFIPGINTKMMMAVIGLGFLVLNLIKKNKEMNKDFFVLNMIAVGVGIASLATMVYNGTPDDSYLTYIVSVWVWCSAAYAVLNMINIVHGRVTFRLVSNYIIAVCVAQTTLAFSMQFVPALKGFVDSFLAGEGFMGKNKDRLYGVGAALDPSGLRFACVLTMTMYMAIHSMSESKVQSWLYIIAYGIILVFGNIMSRTTIVGAVISFIILIYEITKQKSLVKEEEDEEHTHIGATRIVKQLLTVIVIVIPLSVLLYNTNSTVRQNLRFGFEGFFSLVEEGQWHTTSSDGLIEDHWILPDDMETWIIGDGYIASTDIDKNYIGTEYAGYYMGTDIGYCRFLFYFGIIGTMVMIWFFTHLAKCCIKNHPNQKVLFILILCINLIGWFKVSSDVIMVFLPFLCFSSNDLDEEVYLNE